MAFMEEDQKGVHTVNITRQDDRIRLSQPIWSFLGPANHPDDYDSDEDVDSFLFFGKRQSWMGHLASFSGKQDRDMSAFVYHESNQSNQKVVFHDRTRNATVRKQPVSERHLRIGDLAFSPDGKMLVAALYDEDYSICVFDCNVDRIEDIGPPRFVLGRTWHGDYGCQSISFTPNPSKVVVLHKERLPDDNDSDYWDPIAKRIRSVDLLKEQ